MIPGNAKELWLHRNKLFIFKTIDGIEYQDRVERNRTDIKIKDVTPPMPKFNDLGMRKGDILTSVETNNCFKCVDCDSNNLIKMECCDEKGNHLDCYCIHDWMQQENYMNEKYKKLTN